MPRTDHGFGWQGAQFLQIGPHLRCRPLKQPPTAHGHQAVGGKNHAAGRKIKRDMPQRMARHINHHCLFATDRHAVAFGQRQIQPGQAVRIGGGPDDP